MANIEVSGLVVRYGEVTAVDGVTFAAAAGTVLALLGPNGAGKTTTVEVLEGYRPAESGSVRVLGLDPISDHRRLRARIGVMLQQGGLYPSMGPREAIGLFASYYRDPLDPGDLLEQVGLGPVAATPWRRLSGGEQQRLSLALALVGRPEVIFLDEPTAGMDPMARQTLWTLIRGLREQGVTVLLTTHYLEEAERLADHIVIIDEGRVVTDGTPAELMASGAAADIRFGAPPGIDTAGLAGRLGTRVVEERPGEYRVEVAATPANVAALTAWLAEHDLPLSDLRAGRQSLEDVFLRLTGQASTAEEGRR